MENIYKVLIIDDEPPARDLLEAYVNQIPFLACVGCCANAMQALDFIDSEQADLLFLDINMPRMTGLELLGFKQVKPLQVILTTAYPDHALASYEYDVVDYLLKPIAFDRFFKSALKFKEKKTRIDQSLPVAGNNIPTADRTISRNTSLEMAGNAAKPIWIREEKILRQLNPNEVLYLEGLKDYVKIHLEKRSIVTHLAIGQAEELFRYPSFVRVHRSYIVRISAIETINGNVLTLINGQQLSIGPSYREDLKIFISIL